MTISATIIGRLGAPPETRNTTSGHAVTEFRVATDHGFGDRKTTTWVSASIWGKRGQTAADHFSKGDGIILLGCSVYNEEYQGKHYLKAEARDWMFPPKSSEGRSRGQGGGGSGQSQGGYQPQPGGYDPNGEPIPF